MRRRHRITAIRATEHRGTDLPRLQELAAKRGLENVLFKPEVDSREIPALLAQCAVGLIALDPRHKTHNVPGKFLSYMQAGLPVLARINPGTDLASVIEKEGVGAAYVGNSVGELRRIAERLTKEYLSPTERIDAAFRLTFGRPPTAEEAKAADAFVKRFAETKPTKTAWAAFAQALFAAAEFRYVD